MQTRIRMAKNRQFANGKQPAAFSFPLFSFLIKVLLLLNCTFNRVSDLNFRLKSVSLMVLHIKYERLFCRLIGKI